MIYGPNPDDTHDNNPGLMQQIFAVTAGATLERLPVQYEVQIDIAPGYRSAGIKAYGAMADDAEEITAFARRISDALYAGEDISK